jgi:hypothetical protein
VEVTKPMEARIKSLPAWQHVVLGIFTVGIGPLVLALQKKVLPRDLNDDGMTLYNGTRIGWSQFTKMYVTDVHLNGRYVGRRFEIWHTGGKVTFNTQNFHNSDDVVGYVLARLPKGIAAEQPWWR